MLDTLRTIHWPEGTQPAGVIIRASLLAQVSDYDGLIFQAEKKAEEIKRKSEQESREKAEQMRQEIADSVKLDFDKLKQVMTRNQDHILGRSSEVCVEVAKIAVGNFIESLDEQKKIAEMVNSLIRKMHSTSNIVFSAHPSQVSLVHSVLEKGFDHMLKKGDFQINPDNTLGLDQIRVNSVEDAFVDISITNLVSILRNEIEQLKEHFDDEIRQGLEPGALSASALNRETI